MNISGIENYTPFSFIMPETRGGSGSGPASVQDSLDLNSVISMSDEEADALLFDTQQMIAGDSEGALGVHMGLCEDRVYALLGMA